MNEQTESEPKCYVCKRPQPSSKFKGTKTPIVCSHNCAREYNKVRLQKALSYILN
jgi:hypothetical protein